MPRPANPRRVQRLLGLTVTAALVAGALSGEARSQATVDRGTAIAWPWQISLERIHAAVERQSYEVEQLRRVLDRRDPRVAATEWLVFRERVRHVGATEASPARHTLELLGRGDRELSEDQLASQQVLFNDISAFLFHYQSFRVADPAVAQRNYRIRFVGMGERLGRPIYRTRITSLVGERSSWLVDLDVETGLPLYRGEISSTGVLVSEVIVSRLTTEFDQSIHVREGKPEHRFPTARAALDTAGYPPTAEPAGDSLPAGFVLSSAKLFPNLLGGASRVVLTYTDGIDHMFVLIGGDADGLSLPGHAIRVFQDGAGVGWTQCLFIEAGRSFLVIGRELEATKALARDVYAQVVQGG